MLQSNKETSYVRTNMYPFESCMIFYKIKRPKCNNLNKYNSKKNETNFRRISNFRIKLGVGVQTIEKMKGMPKSM